MVYKPADLLIEFGESKPGPAVATAGAKKSNSYLRAMGKMLANMYNDDLKKAKRNRTGIKP